MLGALAIAWPLLLLRALCATAMGVAAFVVPVWSTLALALLFAIYAMADGVLALLIAFTVRAQRGFGAVLAEGLLRLAVGFFVLVSPGRAALALVDVFAIWAVVSGGAAIAVAAALRRTLTGEWPLPLAGAASITMGVVSLFTGAALDARWIVGPYAVLFGFTMLALSLRLRQFALEIAASV